MKHCHAAEISGIVYYVTCCYAAAGVGWGGVGGGMLTFLVLRTWNIAMLLRSPGSFTTLLRYMLLRCWKWNLMKKSIPSNLSAKSDLLMVYARAWQLEMHSQECWLPADNGACVAAMTLKSQKTRPKFFQDFQSSNQHGTVVKSPFVKKTCVLWARFPVRRDVYVYICICMCMCMCIRICICICIYMYMYMYIDTHLYKFQDLFSSTYITLIQGLLRVLVSPLKVTAWEVTTLLKTMRGNAKSTGEWWFPTF